MSVLAPAFYLIRPDECVCSLVTQPSGYLFWGHDYTECRTRDPKVKRIRGELHMKANENLTTREESVKRGGGSVTVVEICTTP